ncbi:Hypothetical predicted protein [Paramuricea clavata]|uniref:Uncharacterized protein n=1 Tax=Paramuricea clavata TaxID=317549 RepID=A0A7D9HIM8_PARCT|nr:Hypothetical predicted protein [Paramuricea clavata]
MNDDDVVSDLEYIYHICSIINNPDKTNLENVNQTPMATSNIDTLSNNSFKQDELVPTIRGFKIASLNITSLPKHIDELSVAMRNNDIDVLAIMKAEWTTV